jgi:diguanylate cyclase (GGDEF)-like protein
MSNSSPYIIFDKSFIIKQTNYPSLETNTDLREYFYEIVGMEESILSLQKGKTIEIPMLFRNGLYYDIEIELFYETPRAYMISMQEHSKQIHQYTNALKEINKKNLIQEIHRAKKELEYAAQHDTLTDLPNKIYLLKEMSDYINKQTPFSLCLLDIDNFHSLNDEYGAHACDMLLKHLSTLLQNFFKEDIVISRVFGDSFAILLNSYKELEFQALEKKIKLTPLRYTQEDIISFSCTLCVEHYTSQYNNPKLFLEHVQNKMKKRKIDKKLAG